MSDGGPGNGGDRRALRDGLIIAIAGSLLPSLLLEPVRAFIGAVWWLLTVAAVAVWGGLATPVPLWAPMSGAAIVALAMRLRRGALPTSGARSRARTRRPGRPKG